MRNTKKSIIYIIGLILILVPAIASADTTSPTTYFQYIFNFALGGSGIVAITMIAIQAVKYIAGAGNPGKQKEATGRIQEILLGVALIFGAWLILWTINPDLVNFANFGKDITPINIASGSYSVDGGTQPSPPPATQSKYCGQIQVDPNTGHNIYVCGSTHCESDPSVCQNGSTCVSEDQCTNPNSNRTTYYVFAWQNSGVCSGTGLLYGSGLSNAAFSTLNDCNTAKAGAFYTAWDNETCTTSGQWWCEKTPSLLCRAELSTLSSLSSYISPTTPFSSQQNCQSSCSGTCKQY